MNWRECDSLKGLLRQLNDMFPDRSKISDGTIGDARHQAEKSDHDPNAAGVVTALDVTHDARSGCTGDWLSRQLAGARDPRVKYIIWNGQMMSSYAAHGYPPWAWRPYHGFSMHTEHVHVSVSVDPKLYDDKSVWDLSQTQKPAPGPGLGTISLGAHGLAVRALQRALGIKIDGSFGPDTDKALRAFQSSHGLREDGIAGDNTWRALGL